MPAWWATWLICRLYFHFQVAVCHFFRSSARAKRFTWKWLDFHENEWTGDIHLVLHQDSFCHRGKRQLGIGLFIYELAQGAFDSHYVALIKPWFHRSSGVFLYVRNSLQSCIYLSFFLILKIMRKKELSQKPNLYLWGACKFFPKNLCPEKMPRQIIFILVVIID